MSTVFQILLWFLFVVATLSVGARLGTKYSVYLAQSVAISLAALHGLGKPMNSLSKDEISGFLKAEYASFVFQLIALALVKWSILAFLQQLSPDARNRRLVRLLRIAVVLWQVPAVLAGLFQGDLPTPWDYVYGRQKLDRGEVYIFTLEANAEENNIHRVIGFAIAQLVVFLDDAFPTSDVTAGAWLPTVLNQAVLSASVVTACAPYLRPLVESLESGIVRVDNLPGVEEEEEELSRVRTLTALSDCYVGSYGHTTICSSPATSGRQ
ncbi:hypothetical protein F5Y17DRAFT_464831 [Xylariaceae sp. FL0594]|nr:hypothetical protein F5Y17DRAFT_464831 [Xylariaceae sp. FL0594]